MFCYWICLLLCNALLASAICKDNNGTEIQPNVEVLDDKGEYYIKCVETMPNSWETSAVACKTSTGDRVEIDDEIVKNGVVHRCWKSADKNAHYDYDPVPQEYNSSYRCPVKDKQYKYGQRFISSDKRFVMWCTGNSTNYLVTAMFCLTKTGITMKANESKDIDEARYSCIPKASHGLQLNISYLTREEIAEPLEDRCKDKNGEFMVNSTFLTKYFVMICEDGGDEYLVTPVACIIDDKFRLAKGEEKILGNYVYKCLPAKDGALESSKIPYRPKK